LRKLALQLYLESLGFRSIGWVLEVSNVTVLNWIRAFGEHVIDLKTPGSIRYTEMDEMHTYVGQKNYRWIWIAVNRYEKKFIDFIVGDRSAQTGKKLWNEIKDRLDGKIATDYWQPYEHFTPDKDHFQSKVSSNVK